MQLTTRPDEAALRGAARTSLLVIGNALNSASFTIRQYESHKYSHHITGNSTGTVSPVPPTVYNIRNESIVLQNHTEITFKVPPNTSLLNITGPVYPEDTNCYFLLDPEPWWWNGGVIPAADQNKPAYRPNQTLIMIPTDPAVEYQLIMGAGGKPCAITAVTAYSYNE